MLQNSSLKNLRKAIGEIGPKSETRSQSRTSKFDLDVRNELDERRND